MVFQLPVASSLILHLVQHSNLISVSCQSSLQLPLYFRVTLAIKAPLSLWNFESKKYKLLLLSHIRSIMFFELSVAMYWATLPVTTFDYEINHFAGQSVSGHNLLLHTFTFSSLWSKRHRVVHSQVSLPLKNLCYAIQKSNNRLQKYYNQACNMVVIISGQHVLQAPWSQLHSLLPW